MLTQRYADTEDQLLHRYHDFQQCEVVTNFLAHIQAQWHHRREWATCYRMHLLVRGNQTNNYAEAGIEIMKDLVFSRKSYNQMFAFITECLELYYTRKLLSVAHNRIDCYVPDFSGTQWDLIRASAADEETPVLQHDNKYINNTEDILAGIEELQRI